MHAFSFHRVLICDKSQQEKCFFLLSSHRQLLLIAGRQAVEGKLNDCSVDERERQ